MDSVLFRSKNKVLVEAAINMLEDERPMTLRQLYYRLVSIGLLDNCKKEYKRLGHVMTRLREANEVPRSWIVDHVRSTIKPSSWTGLDDFSETVQRAYRLDFWASLDHHVEVFVEKDAVAGTIQPVTHKYDIALRVCRGYASVSFAGEIAELWSQITKPIYAYYLGDFDPSGYDIERDLRERLERYTGMDCCPEDYVPQTGEFGWTRLGVRPEDFDAHNLVALSVKTTDTRSKAWRREHGDRCAEVDAIPPTELRARVEEAINHHIDQERWQKLLQVEELERAAIAKVNLGSISSRCP